MKERKADSGQERLTMGRIGAIYSDESNGGFSSSEALKHFSSTHLLLLIHSVTLQMTVKMATNFFIHLF